MPHLTFSGLLINGFRRLSVNLSLTLQNSIFHFNANLSEGKLANH